MKVKSEREVAQLCPTLSDPMDYSLPGSSIHGFSRQEYWSGVPLPSPRYADDITLMAESEEELKSLLTKVKKEIEKASLKLNIQKNRPWHLIP